MHDGRLSWTSICSRAPLELFETDRSSATAALAALPEGLEGVDSKIYDDFVAATDALATDAAAVAERLRAAITEGQLGLAPIVREHIADHLQVVDAWSDACFALSAELATDDPVDCIGLPLELRGEPASDVAVSIECMTGDRLSELPFDRSPFPFFQGPDDQDWMLSRVTIDNRSDDPAQLDPHFRVRYLDRDGRLIAELPWTEPGDAAFWVPPDTRLDQMNLRGSWGVLSPAVRPDDPTPEESAAVLAETATCEVVEPVTVVVTPPDPYIEDVPVEIDTIDCEPRKAEGLHVFMAEFTNPTDRPISIDLIVGFVDADDNRLGHAHANRIELSPGETVTETVRGHAYVIHRAEDVADCRFFLLRET